MIRLLCLFSEEPVNRRFHAFFAGCACRGSGIDYAVPSSCLGCAPAEGGNGCLQRLITASNVSGHMPFGLFTKAFCSCKQPLSLGLKPKSIENNHLKQSPKIVFAQRSHHHQESKPKNGLMEIPLVADKPCEQVEVLEMSNEQHSL